MSAAGIDELALSYVARFGMEGLRTLLQLGVSAEHFDTEYQPVWGYMIRSHREHGSVPSAESIATRYPHVELVRVKREESKNIAHEMRQRHKYIRFLRTATDLAGQVGNEGWDNIDKVLERAIGNYTTLLHENGANPRLLDVFSERAEQQLLTEMKERREQKGLPTGIPGLDSITGGFVPKRMIVSIGRTGSGKTWIQLLHLAHAVMNGNKVALFSLEMTTYEVMMRLYTIFSFVLNPGRPLKNYELERGLVSERKLKKFMSALRERYSGQFFVADAGHSMDPYTIERIMAEVEALRPDMFWVDYLTLLKTANNDKGWEGVRELSRGIKHIAMALTCVGGCSAQVNRDAMSLDGPPQLENISYGDSIGHDANQVVSLFKPPKKNFLYWAMVKNRHGQETGPRKLAFEPDIGNFSELRKELGVGEQEPA